MDWAEEEPVLKYEDAKKAHDIAVEMGAHSSISNIHVNIWMGTYDKLSSSEWFLQKRYGWQPGRDDMQVMYIGDSTNDEALFARFPLAAAVANISRYKGLITHYPAFVSRSECGAGFVEIADTLLERRNEK
jgi:hydroxymethylpyrimidine pyrophosphatase-like HAD family hydrolase